MRLSTPVLWCVMSAALFGASTPVSKQLLDDIGPFGLAGLLYLGAAIAMLPFSFSGGSAERRRQPRHKVYLGLAIVFGGIVGPVLLLFGLKLAASASVSLWLNLETVATVALAWLLFREHNSARTWLAAGFVVAAGALLVGDANLGNAGAAGLVALACICWGIDNNATALLDGLTPAQSTAIKGVVAGSVNLTIAAVVEGIDWPLQSVGLALLVGALAYGVSIALYIRGAQHLGASRSQMLFATAPFLGVALAWTAFGEPVLELQIAAAAIMAVGLYVLLTGEHVHEHEHESLTHSHSHRHDDEHHTHVHPGLPAWIRHTHEHQHEAVTHAHTHVPDLHHRHRH